jgi:endonuclease/exonuclease/phosphatase family metal-dependent hydrolase
MHMLMRNTNLRVPSCDIKTFPSWRPMRNIDHILVSSTLGVEHARALDYAFSDHLPVSMELVLPKPIEIAA